VAAVTKHVQQLIVALASLQQRDGGNISQTTTQVF
jgi:hypothetical protein